MTLSHVALAQHRDVTYRWWAEHLQGGVSEVATSPDGETVVVSDVASNLHVFSTSPLIRLYSQDHPAAILSISVSPDGLFFAIGTGNRRIVLFELYTGRRLWTVATRSEVRQVLFSDDGLRVLWTNAIGEAGAIHLNGSPVWRRRLTNLPLNETAISSDGINFAMTGEDPTIYVLDANNGALRRTLVRTGLNPLVGLGYSAANWLVASDNAGNLFRWDAAGALITPNPISQAEETRDMALSPTGTSMALAIGAAGVRIVDPYTGSMVMETSDIGFVPNRVRFSPDSRSLYVAGLTNKLVQLDSANLALTDSYGTMLDELIGLSWEPNSRRLQVADASARAGITDTEHHNVSVQQTEAWAITSVAWSPTTGQVARGLTSGEVQIRRTSDWTLQSTLTHLAGVTDVEFSLGGTALLTTSLDGTLNAWTGSNFTTRRTIFTLLAPDPLCLALRPSGSHVAIGTNEPRVRVFNYGTGAQVLMTNPLTHLVDRVRFSPNSAFLAVVYGPNIDVFALSDSPSFSITRLYTVTDPDGIHYSDVAFTPDSQRFVAVNSNGTESTLELRNASNGTRVLELDDLPGTPLEIAYSPRQDAIGMIHAGGFVSVVGDPAIDWLTLITPSAHGVVGGAGIWLHFSLSAPAPVTGAILTITVPLGSPVVVPTAVFVPPFGRDVSLFVPTMPVSTPTDVTISGAYRHRATNRTVKILPPTVEALIAPTTIIGGGGVVRVTARLNGPAPAEGMVVHLDRSTSVIGAPSSVIVPAGAREIVFPMSTNRPATTTRTWIRARTGGVRRYLWVEVRP